MDAINETLYSPTLQNGRRKPIHFQSEGSQILLSGLDAIPELNITENDNVISAIKKLADYVTSQSSGANVSSMAIVIPTTGWINETIGDYPYHLDLVNTNLTEDMTPQLIFSATSIKAAREHGIGEACETLDGKLRIYAMSVPNEEISATLCVFGAAGGTPSRLPIASATRAGVVKIGNNIDVTNDGTISVPTSLVDADGNGVPDVVDEAIKNSAPVGDDTEETVSDDDINSVFVD